MLKRFTPVLTVVALCWLAFALNNLLWSGQLSYHGIVPRRGGSLPAIFWAPFLHGSFKHLLANTVPLLVLGVVLCARSTTQFMLVTLLGIVVAGSITWLFARTASHIGASGLVFCYFISRLPRLFRRSWNLALSAVCVWVKEEMRRGILPSSAAVSWESHLAGLIAGIACAWAAAKIPRERTPAPNAPDTIVRIGKD